MQGVLEQRLDPKQSTFEQLPVRRISEVYSLSLPEKMASAKDVAPRDGGKAGRHKSR